MDDALKYPRRTVTAAALRAILGLAVFVASQCNASPSSQPGSSEARTSLENLKPGADLRKAELAGADLKGRNLARVNLSKANLHGADLGKANLYKANLIEADLSGADLSGVNLYQADLRGANLKGANLLKADLKGAELFRAELTGAKCDAEVALPDEYSCVGSRVEKR
jgi:uncharacterized protein YjbI with pentapeptide repeats